MWLFKWIVTAICIFLGVTKIALGAALDPWTTWSTDQPYVSKQVPPNALIMRGIGTDAYYVVEVDATTGAIPVSITGTVPISGTVTANQGTTPWIVAGGGTAGTAATGVVTIQGIAGGTAVPISGSITANNSSVGATGAAVPASGTYIAASVAGTLTGLVATSNGLKVDGSASTQPVSGTVTVSNLPATVSTNVGAADASTLRVVNGSRVYADSANYSYAGGNVTTGTWTQVIATTAAAINLLCITDTSGQAMELGTGANPSETRVFLIAQGWSGCIPQRIASGTRISVRAVTATASTGYLTLSGMN